MQMRYLLVMFTGVMACQASLVCADEVKLPERKAGLWDIKAERSSAPGKTFAMQQCIDKVTDAALQQAMLGVSDQMQCSRNLSKSITGYILDSRCKMGQSTVSSHVVVTGDFSTDYKVVVDSTYSPPIAKLSQVHMVATARHVGACPTGVQPGDILVDGKKMMSMTVNSKTTR